MQLGHDHAFRAVDHERTGRRHERDLAHVDFLLLDLLDLGRVLAVVDDQAHFRAQRRVESQTALLTFLDVERRVGQVVRHEFHACQTIVRHDGEDGVERRLQAFALSLCDGRMLLQELGIRLNLGGKQEGNLMDRCALRETLANTLFLGKAVRHGISESSQVRATDMGDGHAWHLRCSATGDGIWRLAATNLWLTVLRAPPAHEPMGPMPRTGEHPTKLAFCSRFRRQTSADCELSSVPLMFALCWLHDGQTVEIPAKAIEKPLAA